MNHLTKGILLGVSNALFVALGGLFGKAMHGYNAMTVQLCVGVFSIFILPFLVPQGSLEQVEDMKRTQIIPLLGSICLMPAAACFFFNSLFFIEYADAITIMQSHLFIAGILALLVLREALGVTDIICIVMAFLGVFLISRPKLVFGSELAEEDLYPQRYLGVILASLAAFSIATFAICRRSILHINSNFLTMFQGIVSLVLGLIATPATYYLGYQVFPDCTVLDRAFLVLSGFIVNMSFLTNIKLYAHLSVVHSSTLKSGVSVFSYTFQFLFLNEPFSFLSIGGCVLIIASILCKSYWNSVRNCWKNRVQE